MYAVYGLGEQLGEDIKSSNNDTTGVCIHKEALRREDMVRYPMEYTSIQVYNR